MILYSIFFDVYHPINHIIHHASNNLQTYDEELAFGAQKWAEQCVRGHDCDECRTLPRGYRVGQVAPSVSRGRRRRRSLKFPI